MRPLKRKVLNAGKRLLKRMAPRTVRRFSGWRMHSKSQLSDAAERISVQATREADRVMDAQIQEIIEKAKKLPTQEGLLSRSQELKSLPHRLMIEYLVFVSTRDAMNQMGIRTHRKELLEAEDRIFSRMLQRGEAGQRTVRHDAVFDQEAARICSLLGKRKGTQFLRLVNAKVIKARRHMEPALERALNERREEKEFKALTGASVGDLLRKHFRGKGNKT